MEIPRHWRLKAQRYRLEGSACPACGQLIFPSRPICPRCTAHLTRITGWVFPLLPASVNDPTPERRGLVPDPLRVETIGWLTTARQR